MPTPRLNLDPIELLRRRAAGSDQTGKGRVPLAEIDRSARLVWTATDHWLTWRRMGRRKEANEQRFLEWIMRQGFHVGVAEARVWVSENVCGGDAEKTRLFLKFTLNKWARHYRGWRPWTCRFGDGEIRLFAAAKGARNGQGNEGDESDEDESDEGESSAVETGSGG